MLFTMIALQTPMGGESLGLLLGGLFAGLIVLATWGRFVSNLLRTVAFYASITVLVFLRKEIGVRAMSFYNLFFALLFLYFVGNMVGHNYHDMYRDVGATVWGARVHFTYLVLFIVMAAYRKVEAWQQQQTRKPSSWGMPSTLAQFLPTHSRIASLQGFYAEVVMEPLAVVSIGCLLGVVLQNWFGWYLVLTGCLMFYFMLWSYYDKREAALDAMDQQGSAPPAA